MGDYTKGNYNLDKNKAPQTPSEKGQEGDLEGTFESKALEKLSGSIAFIKKSSEFTWTGTKKP